MGIEQFIDNEVKGNDVVLFMKGTPQFPMCGFSGQLVQILDHLGVSYKGINVLESDEIRTGIKTYSNWPTISAALCEGRVCRRLRHRARNVSGRRTAAGVERERRVCTPDRLSRVSLSGRDEAIGTVLALDRSHAGIRQVEADQL